MKRWAEARCWNTNEMESSLWDLRPQSCSEHWKVYFNRGQRISSSRKSHSGTSPWPLLLPSLVLCWDVTRDSGGDCMRSALLAPELASEHAAVWRQRRQNGPSDEWMESVLPGVSCWMLWLREPGLGGGQEARSGEPANFSSWRLRVLRNVRAASPSPQGTAVLRGHTKEYGWASIQETGDGLWQGKQGGRGGTCYPTVRGRAEAARQHRRPRQLGEGEHTQIDERSTSCLLSPSPPS